MNTVVWETVVLVNTVVWQTVVLVETVVWRTVVWCRQSCGTGVLVSTVLWVCMFLRRPERACWYLWTVLRSQLEEGADSEEELWVTDESDTEEEESDSGDGKDE